MDPAAAADSKGSSKKVMTFGIALLLGSFFESWDDWTFRNECGYNQDEDEHAVACCVISYQSSMFGSKDDTDQTVVVDHAISCFASTMAKP